MNIVIFGAGAIGSLFGGILAKNNNVVLIGRKNHVEKIKKNADVYVELAKTYLAFYPHKI